MTPSSFTYWVWDTRDIPTMKREFDSMRVVPLTGDAYQASVAVGSGRRRELFSC